MKKLLFLPVLALAAAGCRTNKDILDDYERSLTFGRYAKPIPEIAAKADGGGVDELMWRLHLGAAQHLAGKGREATEAFDRAEDLFIGNDGRTAVDKATDTTLSILTNDRALPFLGTGQDRIFTCLYKAIDYGTRDDIAAMRTELNRAAEHQDLWLDERRAEIEQAAEKLRADAVAYEKKEAADRGEDDGTAAGFQPGSSLADAVCEAALTNAAFTARVLAKCGFDPARDGRLEDLARKDWINVYAEHVTGLFRWLAGEADAANYLRETAALRPANATVQADLAAVRARTRPANRVWVFVEDGLCPTREEWRLDLPVALVPYAGDYVLYAGMALPYLRDRDVGASVYAVWADEAYHPLEELEDVDRLVRTEYKVYMRGALAREITRTVVKVGTQAALGIATVHAKGKARVGLGVGMLSAAGWAISVTQADLRSWTALPKRVLLCAAPRPSDGVLHLTDNGLPVADIAVPEGNSLVFVRKPARPAVPSVRIVTLPSQP